MKKWVWLVLAIVVVIVLALIFTSRESGLKESPPAAVPLENRVVYTDSGFVPATLDIKAAETVVFENQSSVSVWPASAVHPTHQVYPGSGIAKCGTAEEGKIFDACRGLSPGESWSFEFEERGTWRYHNHLNPRFTGTIVVE